MARVLTYCPYPLLPLRGGGSSRCFHLLRALARSHEVSSIIFQPEHELRSPPDAYHLPDKVRLLSPSDRPPPPSIFDRLPKRVSRALHYRWLRRSWRGPADGVLLSSHHLLREALTANKIDFVLFEHLQSMKAAPLVRRWSPGTRLILDAHNVDHLLYAAEAQSRGREQTRASKKLVARTQWEETHLGRWVDAVWCCSELDRDHLATPSGIPGAVIPNGVDTNYFTIDDDPAKSAKPYLIFSGAMSTDANHDAVTWLLDALWPVIHRVRPDLTLLLVGRGLAEPLARRASSSPGVEFVGEVPDVRPYFRRAALSLVPLRLGSGTRLKILESMSQGNPVVSTGKGAEGLDVADGKHLSIAEDCNQFVAAINRLLDDNRFYGEMQAAASQLVHEQYDWRAVGQKASAALEELGTRTSPQ